MRMYDLIEAKKQGKPLSQAAIHYMIEGFTKGTIPDYQMAAMLMAIYFQGMTTEETNDLTDAMAKSGDLLDLSHIPGVKVDKHSTGGVGDKTSLVLAPLVASLGVNVAKMSGRGLGHTGGTIDKLEAFEGFNVNLTEEAFKAMVTEHHIALAGQTANLAPADKKLYALRDVTATVDQLSLIAGSIMSKKIASGADCIVLDVKCGSGAFMKTETDARALAKIMVDIGNGLGRKTSAVISDMNQPLGYAIGNTLEVLEAIDTLKGHGPEDLLELCLALGSQMLMVAGRAEDIETARRLLEGQIQSGAAYETFKTWLLHQGAKPDLVHHPEKLKKATLIQPVLAKSSGYITHIDTEDVGIAAMLLGGGRETKEAIIDLAVGFVVHKKLGDYVAAGDALATVHANDSNKLLEGVARFLEAYHLSESPIEINPLIKGYL